MNMGIDTFSAIRARRTFEAVVAQIAEAIRNGEFHRGDRLPPERLLAQRMGVSRPTLREAIRVLADAEVIQVRRGTTGGAFVVSETIPPALVEVTDSRVAEIPTVLEARRAFEPTVAQLAAVHATEADLSAMRRIVERQREAVDDWARVTQLDNRFHRELARATKNSIVVSLMGSLARELEIARSIRMPRAIPTVEAINVNESTVDAIASRDKERIEAVMDRHLRLLEDAWAERPRSRKAAESNGGPSGAAIRGARREEPRTSPRDVVWLREDGCGEKLCGD